MDNFFALFQRYLSDKAKGNEMYTNNPALPLDRNFSILF